MFIVIVGCSPTGYQLAKLLMVQQHEVVVLERSLSRCQLMWEEMGSVIIQGDGTDLVDLRRAGASRADTVVAVTGKDETNLVVCQLARHAFSVGRTVAAIKDPRYQPIFRLLGVDAVVDINDLVLDNLERSIVGSSYNHLAHLRSPNALLVSLTIPQDATVIGKRISDTGLPVKHVESQDGEQKRNGFARSFLSVILRGSETLQASDDTVLEANDEVIAVTSADEEETLYEILTGVY